ncbi:cell filamentation protein [Rhizobium sp. NFR07]|uniref:Fic/DOC family protein n=1 Tax=Rhizobium sp. NFR07 TaxID=1566262 RepID=UPI0008E77025|nr:Fic family protein [Rhizobium sp. NFR07]SFB19300.1 cell filamentation protein [Rhizobium sp. NFR07]
MNGDPYVYPGSHVLRNKLGIQDAEKFDYHEREIVVFRSRQGIPIGNFDLKHLRAIHRHLFQDIFDWAGEIRTVEISKGGSQFQFHQYIEIGMADVHRRLMFDGFSAWLELRRICREGRVDHGGRELRTPFSRGKRTDAIAVFQAAL